MKKGHWYPGSMARTVNVLRQDLRIVDLVIELLDARIPFSSRNPVFASLLNGKKHLILLHKADRAEDAVTERWLSYLRGTGLQSMAFSINHSRYQNRLLRYLKDQEHDLRPTRLKRPLRMILVGIPNVGKSTLINHFVRKAVTRTANQPGITRGRQWIRMTPGFELLDTPGILWPNLTEETAKPLAVVGAIPSSRIDLESIALWLIGLYLKKEKYDLLLKRYGGLSPDDPEKILDLIGKSQGCLLTTGKVDRVRAAQLILRDFQAGKLGRMTLEDPHLEFR